MTQNQLKILESLESYYEESSEKSDVITLLNQFTQYFKDKIALQNQINNHLSMFDDENDPEFILTQRNYGIAP